VRAEAPRDRGVRDQPGGQRRSAGGLRAGQRTDEQVGGQDGGGERGGGERDRGKLWGVEEPACEVAGWAAHRVWGGGFGDERDRGAEVHEQLQQHDLHRAKRCR
jgi:hypothetical protein